MTFQTLDIEPYTPVIGGIVRGVDLSANLSNQQFSEIHDALMERCVLFFHDQILEPEDQLRLARKFGEPQAASESSFDEIEGYPEIDVMEYDADSPPYVTTELWHSDFSGSEIPTMGSLLYAHEVPSTGGDTIWVNMYKAYETLSERMKTYLDGMTATHLSMKAFGDDIRSNLWKGEAGQKRLAQLKQKPPVDHPVIRTHPETGRKLLYVNEGYTVKLNGIAKHESEAILNYLFLHIRTPELQCRFRWKKHTLVIWDNRSTQHYALADYSEKRHMHRITIKGDRPV